MNFISNPCTNPWWNMAMDEWLLQSGPSEPVFRLWRNEPSVIIGYNQVAEQEVNLEYLQQHGIKLARRVTGGGAVYHDLQNLNYSFAGPIGSFLAPEATVPAPTPGSAPPSGAAIFAQALRSLGLPAELSGRNDIFLEGRKISGYARSMWHNRELVHGTLMYDVDIETLTAALNVEGSSKLNLKGVGSVRSRVTNVRDYLPQFSSLDELQAALQQYLASVSPTFASVPAPAFGTPIPEPITVPAAGSPISEPITVPAAGSPISESLPASTGREYRLSPSDLAAIDSLCAEKFSIDGWILR
ncbi:MAG: lipoate--protein ligase family protein [Bacteroidales bacterium]|nr:lipoate--protein ligase family protein [Bacteroidales bacterium]